MQAQYNQTTESSLHFPIISNVINMHKNTPSDKKGVGIKSYVYHVTLWKIKVLKSDAVKGTHTHTYVRTVTGWNTFTPMSKAWTHCSVNYSTKASLNEQSFPIYALYTNNSVPKLEKRLYQETASSMPGHATAISGLESSWTSLTTMLTSANIC